MSNNKNRHSLNIDEIRDQARQQLDDGAITDQVVGHEEICKYLQESLSTELVCALRYSQNAIIAADHGAEIVAREFEEHATQEFAHAKMFAQRLSLLGGRPSMDPNRIIQESHAEYFEPDDNSSRAVEDMIVENLVAERIAVATYTKIIREIGDRDPTTRRLFETVLEQEEEHADELMGLRRFSQNQWQNAPTIENIQHDETQTMANTRQIHTSGTSQA